MWQLMVDVLLKVGLPIAVAIGVVCSCRRFNFPRGLEGGTRDIEGIYVTVLATIYAVVLAFMVFVVWTRFDAANSTVDDEACVVSDIQRLAHGLPQPYADRLDADCRGYVESVVKVEWPMMARGQSDTRVSHRRHWERMQVAINKLWDDTYELEKTRRDDAVVRDHLYDHMLRLNDLRRARLLASRTTLPSLLWVLLYFGGILVVYFASIFSVEKLGHHLIKAVALTMLIALTLYVVRTLDHPFQGYFAIPPTPFHVHAPDRPVPAPPRAQ